MKRPATATSKYTVLCPVFVRCFTSRCRDFPSLRVCGIALARRSEDRVVARECCGSVTVSSLPYICPMSEAAHPGRIHASSEKRVSKVSLSSLYLTKVNVLQRDHHGGPTFVSVQRHVTRPAQRPHRVHDITVRTPHRTHRQMPRQIRLIAAGRACDGPGDGVQVGEGLDGGRPEAE